MKVIIRDLRTKTYLAADGRRVAEKPDATDFLTLLQAYHFARSNLSGNFEVLLYCPEDDYSASIITGVGISDSKAGLEPEPVEIQIQSARPRFHQLSCRRRFPSVFDQTKNYLN